MVDKPNYKEVIAMVGAFATPLITWLTTIFTELKVELTADQKVLTVLIATILGTFFLVSILIIDEMQKRREVMKNCCIYKTDNIIANELAENKDRLCQFIDFLLHRADRGEPLMSVNTKLNELKVALKCT